MRIAAILVTLYILVSLMSYSPYDPGLHSTSLNREIANLGGSVGANIAGIAVWVFGFAPILIFSLLLARLVLEWMRGSLPWLGRYFNSATDLFGYLIIWCGLLGGLGFAAGLESAHKLGAAASVGKSHGGVVGDIMASTTRELFGAVGASVLLLVGFVGCVTWLLGVRWLPLMDRTGEVIVAWFKKIRAFFTSSSKEDAAPADVSNTRTRSGAVAAAAVGAAAVGSVAKGAGEESKNLIGKLKDWWASFHIVSKDSIEEEMENEEHRQAPEVTLQKGSTLNVNEVKDENSVTLGSSAVGVKEVGPIVIDENKEFDVPKLKTANDEEVTASLRIPEQKDITKSGLRLRSADSYSDTSSSSDQVEKWRRRAKRNAIPPLDLLEDRQAGGSGESQEYHQRMIELIEENLGNFNISAEVKNIQTGPVITRYELEPAAGVKVSQISNLSNDLARAMSVKSVRVVENIPGTTYVGLEVPTRNREIVSFKHGVASKTFKEHGGELPLMLGDDITGKAVVADLAKMPHLLVAGTTGSGKSVCINALIVSLLYKLTPQQVRFILIDPKMLELSVYEGIPHLLAPVVTDMQQAGSALRWALAEMEQRYKLMSALKVRNIGAYNEKIEEARDNNEAIIDPLQKPGDEPIALEEMPYIVIVIDELADLLMVVGKKVEELIARLAQKARAAGIHLILATQRPSVDVITGLIKANVPTRIAFQVSSKVDSRTVLDQMGAEQLLGHGDMLFLPPGSGHTQRVHGAFLSDDEVGQIVEFLKVAGVPDYVEGVLETPDQGVGSSDPGSGGEEDEYYDQALAIVTKTRRASISAVQRQLRIGYNRAARLIEAMEAAGVVGPMQSNGSREVLAPEPPSDEL